MAMDLSFVDRLREVGLQHGDWLAVFGDVRSITARAIADADIDRLWELLAGAVGKDGHILVPTFTEGGTFDVGKTPAATGRLAERFRNRPGVVRSHHVTQSVAVLGPRAREIVRNHDLYLPFLIETPLGQLVAHGGKVLLFGGDQKDNPLIHVARFSVARDRPVFWTNIEQVLEFGGRRKKRHIEPPCSRAYSALGPEFEARGIARPLETDWGLATWMNAGEVFDHVAAIERDEPRRLLCSTPACRWCGEMRRLLAL